MVKEKIYRHGDMIIFKIDKLPENLKSKNTKKLVVGLGEVTGHSHDIFALDNADIDVMLDNINSSDNTVAENNNVYFKVNNGCAIITHEEHDPIQLDEGTYVRVRQVEYNPFTKQLENVRD